MRRAIKYLVASQLVMLLFAVVCFFIESEAFLSNTAISYYGTLLSTIVPYSLGMLLTALLIYKSTWYLRDQKTVAIRLSLRLIAALMVATWATPYNGGVVLFWTHMVVTFIMLLVVLGTSAYIAVKIHRHPLNLVIVLAEMLMTAILILSLGFWDILHLQAPAQLTISLLFVTILCTTLRSLEPQSQVLSPTQTQRL